MKARDASLICNLNLLNEVFIRTCYFAGLILCRGSLNGLRHNRLFFIIMFLLVIGRKDPGYLYNYSGLMY